MKGTRRQVFFVVKLGKLLGVHIIVTETLFNGGSSPLGVTKITKNVKKFQIYLVMSKICCIFASDFRNGIYNICSLTY